MHVIFMTRGINQAVNHLTMDMQAQKFPMVMENTDGRKETLFIQGALRPIQLWEYVFPKEHAGAVMNTLDFDQPVYPNNLKMKMFRQALRKSLGASKIPEYEKKINLGWIKKDIQILPIGIKEDGEIIEPTGVYKGWKHEAL